MMIKGEIVMDYCLKNYAIRERNGNIRIKATDKKQQIVGYTVWMLALLTGYGFYSFEYKEVNFAEALMQTVGNLITMFTQPAYKHFTISEAFYQLGLTIGLALLTTILGGILALFLGLLAARNLSTARVSAAIRGGVAFIRAVPTILWVLIFAVTAGLGSVAAVIGLSFHSVGYLIKAYSESFEEIDIGTIEAMQTSGANWWQIVFQAVLPSSLCALLAWTFLRFEINFTNAVAMGAAAGAGGIGYELFMAGNFYFDLQEMGMITYLILGFVVLLETCSTRIKVLAK